MKPETLIDPFPLTYQLLEDRPGSDSIEFMTFLARYIPVMEKRKPTGGVKLDLLPVRFTGPSREVAEAAAMRFWADEKARKQASEERGKALAERNKKLPKRNTNGNK